MRRVIVILLLGLIGAVIAYWFAYRLGTRPLREFESSAYPELAWLKQEFALGEAEFARIVQMHQAYEPQCGEMCRRIADQNRKLEGLLSDAVTVTPEIEQAIAESARLRAECQTDMLRHFFSVSHAMPPAQGRRYLEWIRSRTLYGGPSMERMIHDSHP